MTSQLSLFADAEAVDPAAVDDAVRRLGERLPTAIHLGTSSWSFPGWTGLVFALRNGKPATEQQLARHGLAAFMAVLRGRTPAAVTLAVEVRNPELACPLFAAGLRDSGAVPCLAVHACMPPVDEQAAVFGLDRDDCPLPLVARWNLHAGHRYEEARQSYFPFDQLVEEDLPTRDALARLATRATAGSRAVFITINNKAEGSAPRSVEKLAALIDAASLRDQA